MLNQIMTIVQGKQTYQHGLLAHQQFRSMLNIGCCCQLLLPIFPVRGDNWQKKCINSFGAKERNGNNATILRCQRLVWTCGIAEGPQDTSLQGGIFFSESFYSIAVLVSTEDERPLRLQQVRNATYRLQARIKVSAASLLKAQ